jgi:hypothetical protein
VADDEAQSQLATRIPKGLRTEVKVYCVKTDTSIMEFVAQAIAEKLKSNGRRQRRSL